MTTATLYPGYRASLDPAREVGAFGGAANIDNAAPVLRAALCCTFASGAATRVAAESNLVRPIARRHFFRARNNVRMSSSTSSEGAESRRPETKRGRAIFEELLWVHSIIRRDLEIVEQLAADVGEGLPGEAVQDALTDLKTNGPLWRLKVNCLRYCSHVHAHHEAEDVLLFPVLRAADPSIGSVVDRLEADHARVSDLLDVVEAAARALTDTHAGDARQRVIDGLRDLHVHLLDHLDYEELNAGPAMRRLDGLGAG
jgi:hypothetical protein